MLGNVMFSAACREDGKENTCRVQWMAVIS